MGEPEVGEHEPRVSGFHSRHSPFFLGKIGDPTAGQDLLRYRHRSVQRGIRQRRHDLTRTAGLVVGEEALALDDLPRDGIGPFGEL